MWASAELNRLIRLPIDLDELECILARRHSAQVHHYGIEVHGHGYHSPELAELKLRLSPKEKVSVRYRDEFDHVWVHDRFRNVFLQVPVKDKRMLGLSRELWRAAQKALQESGSINANFDQVYQCYRDITADVEEARRSQRLRKRRAASRAKLDKDGWNVPITHPAITPNEMDWLNNPLTTDIGAPFKVTYRPLGGINHE